MVLYVVSAMWNLQVTVFNSKTDEEYRVRHNAVMDHANVNVVFNTRTHYSAAGGLPGPDWWSPACYLSQSVVTLVVTLPNYTYLFSFFQFIQMLTYRRQC